MKPTPEQVAAFAAADLAADDLAGVMSLVTPPAAPEPIPGPYQIALTFAAALLSSGRFGDDRGAAVETAWTLVLPFYQGVTAYKNQGQMLFNIASHASAAEPDMTAEEAHAYVTGGETGEIGEVGAPGGELATVVATGANPDQVAISARWAGIAQTTRAVIAAQAALEEAKARATSPASTRKGAAAARRAVAAAQAVFDAAAKAQSEAYI